MNLDSQSMQSYLVRKRLIKDTDAPPRVTQIGDGMKNLVYLVTTPSERLIVKQALSRVQVKERWWIDRRRIFAENSCIKLLHQILSPAVLPEVLLEDRTDFILVTTAPADTAVLWEDDLESGRIDLQVAVQCGELLATVHNETFRNKEIQPQFTETKAFEQMRLEPYYERIIRAYPDMRKVIEEQTQALTREACCLVLGDLRPRNVHIVNGRVYLVDFAMAHYGCPSFDLAFYATDMCVKAMNNSTQKAAYLEAVNVFWNAYFQHARYDSVQDTARLAVCDLGCQLLAVTDGRQPQMLPDEHTAELSRRMAQSLLFTRLEHIEDITEFITRTLIDG